jgi:hypothetical protein
MHRAAARELPDLQCTRTTSPFLSASSARTRSRYAFACGCSLHPHGTHVPRKRLWGSRCFSRSSSAASSKSICICIIASSANRQIMLSNELGRGKEEGTEW